MGDVNGRSRIELPLCSMAKAVCSRYRGTISGDWTRGEAEGSKYGLAGFRSHAGISIA